MRSSSAPYFPASFAVSSLVFRFAESRLGKTMFFRRPVLARWWFKANAVHWRREGGYRDFVEWFIAKATTESHQTKTYEDAVGWALDTDGETLIQAGLGVAEPAAPGTRRGQLGLARRLRCPVLVIGGTKDEITPFADARLLAKATGGTLLPIEGGDHVPEARHPVEVNLAIRQFVDPTFRPDRRPHRNGGKRALFVSSPIGLGHTRRDIAIARELRALVPGLEVDWLAQDPVTRVLDRATASGCTRRASTWPARPRTSSPSPPSTTCTASRRCGTWTRS